MDVPWSPLRAIGGRHFAAQDSGKVGNAPREAAVDANRTNWAISEATPLPQGLGGSINYLSRFRCGENVPAVGESREAWRNGRTKVICRHRLNSKRKSLLKAGIKKAARRRLWRFVLPNGAGERKNPHSAGFWLEFF